MTVAAWVFLVVAVLAIASFTIVLVLYLRKPSPDQKLLKAIDDAERARRSAGQREEELQRRIDDLKASVDKASSISDERKRLQELADLANRFRKVR